MELENHRAKARVSVAPGEQSSPVPHCGGHAFLEDRLLKRDAQRAERPGQDARWVQALPVAAACSHRQTGRVMQAGESDKAPQLGRHAGADTERLSEDLVAELLGTRARAAALSFERARLALAAGEAGRLVAENEALRRLLAERSELRRRGRLAVVHGGGTPVQAGKPPARCEAAVEAGSGEDHTDAENDALLPRPPLRPAELAAELAAAADQAAQDPHLDSWTSSTPGREGSGRGSFGAASTPGSPGSSVPGGTGAADEPTETTAAPQAAVRPPRPSGSPGDQQLLALARPDWDDSPIARSHTSAPHSATTQQPGPPRTVGQLAALRRSAGTSRPSSCVQHWVPQEALAVAEEWYLRQGLAAALPWTQVEALLAQVDAAFRRREAARLQQQRDRFDAEAREARRRCESSRSTPLVVARNTIARLKSQLAEARQALEARDGVQHRALLQVAERGHQIGRELDASAAACHDLRQQLAASEAARRAAVSRVRGAFLAGACWQARELDAALGSAQMVSDAEAAQLRGFTRRLADDLGLEALLLPKLVPRQEAAVAASSTALAAVRAHVEAIAAAARSAGASSSSAAGSSTGSSSSEGSEGGSGSGQAGSAGEEEPYGDM